MEKRNNYFYASAILTVILACLEIIGAVIALSVFFSSKQSIVENLTDPSRIDWIQAAIVTSSIVSLVIGALTVIVGCFFFSFAKYNQKQINDRTAFIIIMIILQVIFGGLIACAISVAGIIEGKEGEMAKIHYDKIDSAVSYEQRLLDAKKLYEEKLIDYEEYKQLRQEILEELKAKG